jgi:hypothetical protein
MLALITHTHSLARTTNVAAQVPPKYDSLLL